MIRNFLNRTIRESYRQPKACPAFASRTGHGDDRQRLRLFYHLHGASPQNESPSFPRGSQRERRRDLGFHLAATICLVLAGSTTPLAAALAMGGGEDVGPTLGAILRFLKLAISQPATTLWWLCRCSAKQESGMHASLSTSLVVSSLVALRRVWNHQVAATIECRISFSVHVCVVSEDSDQFKGSMKHWSSGARAQRLPSCHEQHHTGSSS
jgi:hypothetical protein